VTLEMKPEDTHQKCRSDVIWQTVPYTSSGNRKGSVADGRQLSVADNSAMDRGRMQSLISLGVRSAPQGCSRFSQAKYPSCCPTNSIKTL